ncbi:MAG TPA: hypothetical protein VFO64_09830 [Gaiellaceae bacterium]|nr:hypothetical protein [Gaiellaceae bacterium]
MDLDVSPLADPLYEPVDHAIVAIALPSLTALHRDHVCVPLVVHYAGFERRTQQEHELTRHRFPDHLVALLVETHGAPIEVNVPKPESRGSTTPRPEVRDHSKTDELLRCLARVEHEHDFTLADCCDVEFVRALASGPRDSLHRIPI